MLRNNTWNPKKNDVLLRYEKKPREKGVEDNQLVIKMVLGIIMFVLLIFVGLNTLNNAENGASMYDNKSESTDEISSTADAAKENIIIGDALAPPPNQDDSLPSTVEYYDLSDYSGSPLGKENKEIVLLLIPLRNAEKVLPLMFRNLMNMTYDHNLIDIAFLVSDCSDDDKTLETLYEFSTALQEKKLLDLLDSFEKKTKGKGVFGSSDLYLKYMPEGYIEQVKKAYSPPYHDEYLKPFRSIQIFQKDFGQVIGQGFSDRHDVKIQGIRRKLMGRARNWLLSNALKPYHSWVYWRDVDIEMSPGNILEFMMKFSNNFDIIVPNVWRPLPTFLGEEQPYDLNSWIESPEGLKLAETLSEDDVIVEGYAEYSTWRAHLAYIRDQNADINEVIDLDGVGGVSILAKAKIFRSGVNFPAFTFLNHAETEAFGKLAKKMGFRVGGLPHYTIWHIYEPSEDDLIEISRLERKKRRFGKNVKS